VPAERQLACRCSVSFSCCDCVLQAKWCLIATGWHAGCRGLRTTARVTERFKHRRAGRNPPPICNPATPSGPLPSRTQPLLVSHIYPAAARKLLACPIFTPAQRWPGQEERQGAFRKAGMKGAPPKGCVSRGDMLWEDCKPCSHGGRPVGALRRVARQ
jgi:hypothetical protein